MQTPEERIKELENEVAELNLIIDDLDNKIFELEKIPKEKPQHDVPSFVIDEEHYLDNEPYAYKYAKRSHKYYQKDPKRLKVFTQDQTEKTLKGFYLDIKSMKHFNDMSGYSNVKKYFLMLGRKPEGKDGANRGKFNKHFTLMVLGIDDKDQVKIDEKTGEPYIYEYLTPCPDTCSNIIEHFPAEKEK